MPFSEVVTVRVNQANVTFFKFQISNFKLLDKWENVGLCIYDHALARDLFEIRPV